MMANIRMRAAGPDDAEAISALVNSAYRGESSKAGWTTEAELVGGQRTDPSLIRMRLSGLENAILLIHEREALSGCVLLQNKADRAYLGMLTVQPTLQAAGLGKHLLAFAEDWVKRQWKLTRIEMTVIRKRKELVAWYVRRGYRDTGRREPFPYGDEKFGIPKVPDLDFIVMEKLLEVS